MRRGWLKYEEGCVQLFWRWEHHNVAVRMWQVGHLNRLWVFCVLGFFCFVCLFFKGRHSNAIQPLAFDIHIFPDGILQDDQHSTPTKKNCTEQWLFFFLRFFFIILWFSALHLSKQHRLLQSLCTSAFDSTSMCNLSCSNVTTSVKLLYTGAQGSLDLETDLV